MKFRTLFHSLLLTLTASALLAQVASHTPTKMSTPPAAAGRDNQATMELIHVDASGKSVLRVNGNVLTDRDVLHEMYAIFPYAEQHSGFPKSLESEIRKGAKQMLVFEELVYQEAERRKIAIAPERINASEQSLRKELGGAEGFKRYLQVECKGSREELRKKIRRSLLIEAVLKSDVYGKATPNEAQIRAYYDKNIAAFSHGDSVHIQTVSIMPPPTAGAEVKKEAQKKAEDAYAQAKKAKTYQEFGLVAEKFSDDDWHVKLGDRKFVETAKLPPPLIQAAAKMKDGEISPLIQLGTSYTFFRLIEHKAAGKEPFASVRAGIKDNLKKERTEQFRAELNQKLHKGAKIEEL
jgi:peptidyl-prolyl cis-trans isomerase SurA